MGIFYNHLFKQRMGVEPETVKTEPASETASSSNPAEDELTIRKRPQGSKSHQYRKRTNELDDSPVRDSSPKRSRAAQSPVRDARSRSRSPNQSSSGACVEHSPERQSSSRRERRSRSSPKSNIDVKTEPCSSGDETQVETNNKEDASREIPPEENKTKKITVKETKEGRENRIRKLFAKRTIGDLFTEAQLRYFQRKSERAG